MNQTKKRTFIVVAFVLAALIIFWVRFEQRQSDWANDTSPRIESPEVQESSPEHTPSGSGGPTDVAEPTPKLDTSDYAQCQQFLRKSHSERTGWGRDNFRQWASYLDQGYTLDEVTLAVEHFTNSNFASTFRLEQLRKDTAITQLNRELNKELRQQIPEMDDSFSVQRLLPLPALESFADMTDEEKAQVLSSEPVKVDDVAYFIHSGLPKEDILMMLDAVDDPRAVISNDLFLVTSLLDFAIDMSRPDLVEAFLNRGFSPTSDAYLGSSMEWALSSLIFSNESRKEDAIAVIKLLKRHGAAARFDIKRQDRIEGQFPRRMYRFDEARIRELAQEHQLDLTQIQQRETPELDEGHPLIQALEEKRMAYLSELENTGNYRVNQAACQRTVDAINSQWQPERANDVIVRISRLHDFVSLRIIDQLAEIDPMLVDMYRERLDRASRPTAIFNLPQKANEFLREGKINKAIDYLEQKSLNDEQKATLVLRILGFNIDYIAELVGSQLWNDGLEFRRLMAWRPDADKLRTLELHGVDLRGTDSSGKTLLYHVVQRGDLNLVSYLQSQGYPFSIDDLGADPLHVALRPSRLRLSIDGVEEMVDILMEYNPSVDDFHRSRMAVLQLLYPESYESIVARHPQLAVNEDTKLPRVR